MFLELPREEKLALYDISSLIFSQAPSRSARGMHLKTIQQGSHLVVGIANMDKGQRSRVPGIWRPRTVWIKGCDFLIPVLCKSLALLWSFGTHGRRVPHPDNTMDMTCSPCLPLITKPIVVHP